jgi:hypothetical protein
VGDNAAQVLGLGHIRLRLKHFAADRLRLY